MKTNPEYRIRLADDSVGPALSVLIAEIFKDYDNCLCDESEFSEHEAIASYFRMKDGEIWIVEGTNNQEVLGCFAITALRDINAAELHKVYLSSKMRGTGIAQKLYNEGLFWAQKQGLTQLRLWTDTRFSSGHRFYEKLGFRRMPVSRFLADVSDSWEYMYINTSPQPA